MNYEIVFYNLQGEFKKISGLFTLEERFMVLEGLRKANSQNRFFTALYAYPKGEFNQAWTYADFSENTAKRAA